MNFEMEILKYFQTLKIYVNRIIQLLTALGEIINDFNYVIQKFKILFITNPDCYFLHQNMSRVDHKFEIGIGIKNMKVAQ